ncbi:hypothetical protein HNQ50_002540 [Silvimonas terrae]|uniref:ATP-binding protein n=1 Tax=Silvimonas terrae TaxID=300266 RepID=A0A840RHA2_9NEIS|nr:hypothetical protein [Silvimonas terrae]MBB5191810.1 hypothetical protein [Silvimonas terrae]
MIEKTDWHFSREKLAEVVLRALQTGLAEVVTVAAASRMGKTEFLEQDLRAHAEKMGWQVHSFCCGGVATRVLMRRLEEALSEVASQQKWLEHPFAGWTGAASKPQRGLAQRMVHSWSQRWAEQKTALFLLDDADRLLQLVEGETRLRELLRAFAGAARHAKLVLSCTLPGRNQGLPLLLQQQSTVFNLPDIGDAFARHLVGQYQQLTANQYGDGRVLLELASPYHGITWGQVDDGMVLDAFNRLQRIPYYLRALVQYLVLNPDCPPEQALQLQLAHLQRHSVATLVWEEMSRLDRLLLMQVAKGVNRFYGVRVRAWLAEKIGVADVSTSQVQSSLKKLVRNRVLIQEAQGGYQMIDPHLAAAISAREDVE